MEQNGIDRCYINKITNFGIQPSLDGCYFLPPSCSNYRKKARTFVLAFCIKRIQVVLARFYPQFSFQLSEFSELIASTYLFRHTIQDQSNFANLS